jgi:uncharacterized protein (TIGR03083 family)
MNDAIGALEADREALLGLCRSLGESDWALPSGCEGWTVKDVVSHMGALFWAVVDPAALPDPAGRPTEQAQEFYVGQRRSMSSGEVLEEYASVSQQALVALAGLAGMDLEVPLGDLGTYPARVLPTAFCFDHFVHIRSDLFSPRGPLPGPPPVSDARRLGPALEWIEAALPQQNAQIAARLAASVDLVITGNAGRTIRFGPPGPVGATVTSDADAAVRWMTQRGSWEELGVRASGHPELLAEVQKVKVF